MSSSQENATRIDAPIINDIINDNVDINLKEVVESPISAKSSKSVKSPKLGKNGEFKQRKILGAIERDYKPVFAGNSWQDLVWITLAVLAVWVFTCSLFAILLHGAIQTDENHTLLWTFFGFFFLCICCLGLALYISHAEECQKGQHDDKDEDV